MKQLLFCLCLLYSCNNDRPPIRQLTGVITDKFISDNGEWAEQQYVHYLRIQTSVGVFIYHCGRMECAPEAADYYSYNPKDSVSIKIYQGEEHDNNAWGITKK